MSKKGPEVSGSTAAAKALRSRIMRGNRSHGNLSTEVKLAHLMRTAGLTGWRRKTALLGRPDFVFRGERIAIFVDGCYWHGCECRRPPKSNYDFWQDKFSANRMRDRRVTRFLRASGWSVIRCWEHELKKSPALVIKRIQKVLGNKRDRDPLKQMKGQKTTNDQQTCR